MSQLVRQNFAAFLSAPHPRPVLSYELGRDDNGLFLFRDSRDGEFSWSTLSSGECLFLLEKDLTIELQRRNARWYFLHAAALRYRQRGFLLVGRSGGGKSTTCWGLLHHGCDYLSDELAPIDLQTMHVRPYPHALCMKTDPPVEYSLPAKVLRTEATLHIPPTMMPGTTLNESIPVDRIFFVEHRGVDQPPRLARLGSAEASALLYAQALNPLSHPDDGIDGAVDLARHCRCFQLSTGPLAPSIELLLQALDASET